MKKLFFNKLSPAIGAVLSTLVLSGCKKDNKPQIEGLKSCMVTDFKYTESTGRYGNYVTLHFIYKVEIEYEKDIQEILDQKDWLINGSKAVKVFDIEESKSVSSAGFIDTTEEINQVMKSIMTDASQYTFAYSGSIKYKYEWDWDDQYHHITNSRWTTIPEITDWTLKGI